MLLLLVAGTCGCVRDESWAELCVTADPDLLRGESELRPPQAMYCVAGHGELVQNVSAPDASTPTTFPIPGTLVIANDSGESRSPEVFVQITVRSDAPYGVTCLRCGEVGFAEGTGAPRCVLVRDNVIVPAEGIREYSLHLDPASPIGDEIAEGSCP